jgi:hypothetical protein
MVGVEVGIGTGVDVAKGDCEIIVGVAKGD